VNTGQGRRRLNARAALRNVNSSGGQLDKDGGQSDGGSSQGGSRATSSRRGVMSDPGTGGRAAAQAARGRARGRPRGAGRSRFGRCRARFFSMWTWNFRTLIFCSFNVMAVIRLNGAWYQRAECRSVADTEGLLRIWSQCSGMLPDANLPWPLHPVGCMMCGVQEC
jgi:hypothetical protein